MGYRFSDFINDAVKPVTGVISDLNPLNGIFDTVKSLGSSLSMHWRWGCFGYYIIKKIK